MRTRYTKGIVAVVAAVGATGALAAGSQTSGTIQFTGTVLGAGYSVTAAPRAAGAAGAASATNGLETHAAASGGQVVVDFSTLAARPVPAVVSVAARTKASPTWQRVGAARNETGVRAQYVGFKGNVLAGKNGTLTLSSALSAQPVLVVIMVAYR
ncbi:hypothetical protein [Ralstonia sp. SET104]|uniref:hypothetical protein n=1 Tax=Ralstonia sp. SET104 TaxID=2448774 RepID=UPI000F58D25C|nr:hypothetical protein [Ralstonia sp. SET104]GCB02723.1 hypothetical protein PSUB009319_03540 [Ralstonia sp. SET104]